MNHSKKPRFAHLAAFWLLVAILSVPGASAVEPRLLLVSIDGLVPDYYVRPDRFGLRIPIMRQLRRDGFYAEGVIGVYPTLTYPSHTTIVTGARPADHGIVSNTVFDDPTQPPTKRWYWEARHIKTDTLWAAAHRAGRRVASILWPVTVGAEQIDPSVPEVWDPALEFSILSQMLRRHATPGLIDEVLKSHHKTDADYRLSDQFAVDATVHVIERYKPDLLMVHLIDLDKAQHDYGPYSQPAFEEMERKDAQLSLFLEALRRSGLEESTTVAIVSDHGFMRVDKQFNPGVLLVEAGLIRLNEAGQVISWGAAVHSNSGSAAVYLKDPRNQAVAARVKEVFERYAEQPNSPIRQILYREDLDRLGADPNAFLFLEAATHYGIGSDLDGPIIEDVAAKSRGKHGYLPDRPELHASLILWGRGVRPGRQELVRMTDIAPTLARLLNIPFQPPIYSQPLSESLAGSWHRSRSVATRLQSWHKPLDERSGIAHNQSRNRSF